MCKHFQESSALVENDFSKPLKKYHRGAKLIDGFSENAMELILVDILHVTLNVLKGGLCVNFSSHMELVIVLHDFLFNKDSLCVLLLSAGQSGVLGVKTTYYIKPSQ